MILFGLPRGIKIIDSEVIDDINIPCLTGLLQQSLDMLMKVIYII